VNEAGLSGGWRMARNSEQFSGRIMRQIKALERALRVREDARCSIAASIAALSATPGRQVL